MTTITIYIDNSPSPLSPELTFEHGLSLGITTDQGQWLCDMGKTEAFLGNARAMGHDLLHLDGAIVSHGHNDHTGGLAAFLNYNLHCPIYAQRGALSTPYFSARHGADLRNISSASGLEQQAGERLHYLDGSTWLTPTLAAVSIDHRDYPLPYGNRYLLKRLNDAMLPDDFTHEQALVEVCHDGLIIVSSCSHCGVRNIIEACQSWTGVKTVKAFIGGLHFVDSNHSLQEARSFIAMAHNAYPRTEFYTGHCTGPMAQQILKEEGGPRIHLFATGTRLQFI